MSPPDSPRPPRALELTVDLPTDRDTVWRLLTDPAGLAEWFAPHGSGRAERRGKPRDDPRQTHARGLAGHVLHGGWSWTGASTPLGGAPGR